MLRSTILTGLALSLASFGTVADTSGEATMTVWETDFSGRPPFERRRVEVPVADVARFEAEPVETVTVRKTDFSGRPPFRRSYQEVPVIDAASLEPAVDSGPKPVTPRPFHKPRHR